MGGCVTYKTTEEKEGLIQECREAVAQNGITVRQWCRDKGIGYSTYYYWIRHMHGGVSKQTQPKGNLDSKSQAPIWAAIPIKGKQPEPYSNQKQTGHLAISYNGFRIELQNDCNCQMLTEVLRAVKQVCC